MKTPDTYIVDRAGWPKGAWDQEPDRVDFRTKPGYPALLLRQDGGHLCGYVAVAKDHPALKLSDEEIDAHGGITGGGPCAERMCHVPEPGEPDDVVWYGFDAAHSGDESPRDVMRYGRTPNLRHPDVYRTVEYMRAECEKLAAQLKGLE